MCRETMSQNLVSAFVESLLERARRDDQIFSSKDTERNSRISGCGGCGHDVGMWRCGQCRIVMIGDGGSS